MTNYVCNKPLVLWTDVTAAEQVLHTGNIAQGEKVEELEAEFAKYCNRQYGIAMCNATQSFGALFEAILEPGDEVIIQSYTWRSVIYEIIRAGAIPVLIDVDQGFQAEWYNLKYHITEKTKAIIVTHLFGMPDDYVDRLVIDHPELIVIEDCAQAIGAKYMDRNIGDSQSHYAIFSLYATKNITCGEGGVIVTNSQATDSALRKLRNNDMYIKPSGAIAYGTNRRLTDFQAAIALEQMRRIEDITRIRNEQAAIYRSIIGRNWQIVEGSDRHAWHHYTVTMDTEKDRNFVVEFLKSSGIQAGIYYDPVYGDLPEATRLSKRVFSLPLGPLLSISDISFIAKETRRAIDESAA